MLVPVCDICAAPLLNTDTSHGDTLSSLSCGHVYHSTCIRHHVATSYDCKICHCPASVASIFTVSLSSQEYSGNMSSMWQVIDMSCVIVMFMSRVIILLSDQRLLRCDWIIIIVKHISSFNESGRKLNSIKAQWKYEVNVFSLSSSKVKTASMLLFF